MPSLFYAGQPDYIEKLNTLATAASMTNGTVAASFLSLAVTGTATAASFVGPLTGNASTATTLATARNINGVSFNGSADITVTAAAGTLTGNTLAAGVTASSLTSVGTLTALAVSGTSTLGVTRASAADGAITFGVQGTTRGFRVVTSSYGTELAGVDNTLAASYQPMNVLASALGLYTVGTNNIAFGTNSTVTQAYVTPNATAVNALVITGGSTGNAVSLSTTGSDANRGITLTPAGAGVVTAAGAFAVTGQASFAAGSAAAPSVKVGTGNEGLYSLAAGTLGLAASGRLALRLETVTNSVNCLYGYANLTGGAPVLRALGSDTNVSLIVSSQAAGNVDIMTGGATVVQARFPHVASAVNFWQIQGAVTGGFAQLTATGTDTNVNAAYVTKGLGAHFFYSGVAPLLALSSGGAAGVNYLQVQGAVTGVAPSILSQGTDTNINVSIASKGTGNVGLYTGSGAVGAFFVTHTASGVNWIQATGSTTGNAVALTAGGSDTNIDFAITPKGTGLVRITGDSLRIVTSKTPASAAATGTQGQISWDADYIYVCTANNTWKRAALATW